MATVTYNWKVGSINRRGLTSQEVEEAIFEALAYYARTLMRKHFASGNSFRYGYKGLSPAYIKQKLKKYGLKPILVATGELKEAVLSTWDIHRVGNRYAISWSVPDHGVYHITGLKDGTIRDWRKESQSEWSKIKDRIDRNLNVLRKGGSL